MSAPCATGCPFLACGPCPYQGEAWTCQVCGDLAPVDDPVCTKCGLSEPAKPQVKGSYKAVITDEGSGKIMDSTTTAKRSPGAVLGRSGSTGDLTEIGARL